MFKPFLFVCLALMGLQASSGEGPPEHRVRLCTVEAASGQFGYNTKQLGLSPSEFAAKLAEFQKDAKKNKVDPEYLFHGIRGMKKAFNGADYDTIFEECMASKQS